MEYLILINANDQGSLKPEEEEKCMTEYGVWAQALAEKHILGRRLELTEGKLLKSKRIPSTDGPFAEGKELIVGIVIIQADSLEEAASIADTCPLGDYFHLYVREIMA